MTKSLKIIIGIMGVAILTLGIMLFTGNGVGSLGANVAFGPNHYQSDVFLQGLYAGTNRQLSISNAGLLVTSGGITNSGTLTLGTNGSAITLLRQKTASVDFGAITSTTQASSIILTPYATAGDFMVVTLDSATTTEYWFLTAAVTAGSGTATASTTVYLNMTPYLAVSSSTASVDLSTSTVRLLYGN